MNDIKGIILLPDTYAHPYGVTALSSINIEDAAFTANTYDSANWAKMESAGAVFLPAAGKRFVGSEVFHVGNHGYYWSSSASLDNDAELVFFKSSSVNPVTTDSRWGGCSVRLVTDVN